MAFRRNPSSLLSSSSSVVRGNTSPLPHPASPRQTRDSVALKNKLLNPNCTGHKLVNHQLKELYGVVAFNTRNGHAEFLDLVGPDNFKIALLTIDLKRQVTP